MGKMKYKLEKVNEANKEILMDILEREGVKNVTLSFDGSGDDGSIEDNDLPDNVAKIKVEGCKVSDGTVWSAGKHETRWKTNCTVADLLHSICYEVLEGLYGGWENNDGAYGCFILDVKKRKITFEFNERYVESNLYTHEF